MMFLMIAVSIFRNTLVITLAYTLQKASVQHRKNLKWKASLKKKLKNCDKMLSSWTKSEVRRHQVDLLFYGPDRPYFCVKVEKKNIHLLQKNADES